MSDWLDDLDDPGRIAVENAERAVIFAALKVAQGEFVTNSPNELGAAYQELTSEEAGRGALADACRRFVTVLNEAGAT